MYRASLGLVVALLFGGGFPTIAVASADLFRLDERTALMLDAQKLTIGIPSLEYGVVARLSLGPDRPARAAPPFTAKGRYHLDTGKLVFESSGMLDPSSPVGDGDGTTFVPGTEIGYAPQTFVPAASLSFAF